MKLPAVPLDAWARAQWGDSAPSIETLRVWARSGRIYPMPKKIGRIYLVRPEAEYVKNPNELVRRLHDTA